MNDGKDKANTELKSLYGIILPSNKVQDFYIKSGFSFDAKTGHVLFDPK
jgi:hypothetical protein